MDPTGLTGGRAEHLHRKNFKTGETQILEKATLQPQSLVTTGIGSHPVLPVVRKHLPPVFLLFVLRSLHRHSATDEVDRQQLMNFNWFKSPQYHSGEPPG